jgi:Uma2 family endonuclease
MVVTYFNANLRARYGRKFRAFPEYRMEVRANTRFRVPDISVLAAGHPKTPYMELPPLISIEILSPDDKYGQALTLCWEYVKRGCENVWLLDPRERTVTIVDQAGYRQQTNRVVEFTLNGERIEVDFNEIFAEMDQE